MTDVNVEAFLNPVGSNKVPGVNNRISLNQSAWKKELESQLYDKQNNVLPSDSKNTSLVSSNEGGLQNDSTLFSDLAGMQGERKVEVDSLRQAGLLNNEFSEKNSGVSVSVKNVPLNKSVDLLPVSTLVIHSATVGQTTGASKVMHTEIPAARAQSDYSSKIKPFNIQLLAGGELLIRDYKQGLLSDARLENIVADLKKIMKKDIEKIRINGEVVWQSNKQPAADQYIIDLV